MVWLSIYLNSSAVASGRDRVGDECELGPSFRWMSFPKGSTDGTVTVHLSQMKSNVGKYTIR